MLKLLPYKMTSESARDLAKALGIKRIRREGSYVPGPNTTIVNWGSSVVPTLMVGRARKFLNAPGAVRIASNKLLAFQALKAANIAIPDFTTDAEVAKRWLATGFKVVCRHKLCGTNGEGIQIVRNGEALPYAPLYVKYFRKQHEYRLHVFQGRLIDITEKRKRRGVLNANPYVRNLDGGWVYCRENVDASYSIKELAIKGVAALGLDFGAVDLVERDGIAKILEINTAPGLKATTLQAYIEALERLQYVRV